MEMWNGALSWCNSQYVWIQISGRSLHTFSFGRRNTSQQYAKLTVWPARTSSLFLSMSKKIMSNALNFAFNLPLLFRSRRVWISRERLMLSSPNACLIIVRISVVHFPRFAQNLTHTRYCFVGSIAKSHHARYTIYEDIWCSTPPGQGTSAYKFSLPSISGTFQLEFVWQASLQPFLFFSPLREELPVITKCQECWGVDGRC
jgi:hypothetical protein